MVDFDNLDLLAAQHIMKWDSSIYETMSKWHPSRDIKQAFECLEIMSEELNFSGLSVLSFDRSTNRWYAEIRINDKIGVTSIWTSGWDSAAEAIVRACLKVKGLL